MPNKMYAILHNHLQAGDLVWTQTDFPILREQSVIVKIHAVGINRADLLQRKGLYEAPAGASSILGLECAGEIVECGTHVENWKIGDKVCALLPGGAYAEFAEIPATMLLPLPAQWSYIQGAAFPEAIYTSYLNLIAEARLQAGETCVIHGGGSGIGTMAIQLAKAFGAKVFTTAGSEEKVMFCRQIGADVAVNYKDENFLEEFLGETDYNGTDVILDIAGAKFLTQNIKLLRKNGRLIVIGLLSGSKAEIDLSVILTKNIRLIGSTLRDKPDQEKQWLSSLIKRDILPLVQLGIIRPIIDSVLPISAVHEAHERMKGNKNIGKIVLELP